jgi:hypothetical protein
VRDKDDFLKKLQALIDKTKEYLKRDIWQKSFLLKRRRQEITERVNSIEAARDDVLTKISQIGKEDVVAKQHMLRDIPDGTMVVYVLLSQKKGRDMTAWETTLTALPSCSFGRPMYLKESDVQNAITSQGDPLTSGYAAVYVDHGTIINDGKELDTLGQAIISLKPGAIDSDHIIKFVHYNTQSYFFVDKKLIIDEKSNKHDISSSAKMTDAVKHEAALAFTGPDSPDDKSTSETNADESSESTHGQSEDNVEPSKTMISVPNSDGVDQPETTETEAAAQKDQADDTVASTADDESVDAPKSESTTSEQPEDADKEESSNDTAPNSDGVGQPETTETEAAAQKDQDDDTLASTADDKTGDAPKPESTTSQPPEDAEEAESSDDIASNSDVVDQPETTETEAAAQKDQADDTAASTADDKTGDAPEPESITKQQPENAEEAETIDDTAPNSDGVDQPETTETEADAEVGQAENVAVSTPDDAATEQEQKEPTLSEDNEVEELSGDKTEPGKDLDTTPSERPENEQRDNESIPISNSDSVKKSKPAGTDKKTKPSPKATKSSAKSKAKKQKDASDS